VFPQELGAKCWLADLAALKSRQTLGTLSCEGAELAFLAKQEFQYKYNLLLPVTYYLTETAVAKHHKPKFESIWIIQQQQQ
jgi:hypothetical protein